MIHNAILSPPTNARNIAIPRHRLNNGASPLPSFPIPLALPLSLALSHPPPREPGPAWNWIRTLRVYAVFAALRVSDGFSHPLPSPGNKVNSSFFRRAEHATFSHSPYPRVYHPRSEGGEKGRGISTEKTCGGWASIAWVHCLVLFLFFLVGKKEDALALWVLFFGISFWYCDFFLWWWDEKTNSLNIIFPRSKVYKYIEHIDDGEMKIEEDKNCELIIYVMTKGIYMFPSVWWNHLVLSIC